MSIHLQQPVNNWLEAVDRLPAGSLVKAVSVQPLAEAKAHNASVYTMLRYVNDALQDINPDDTETTRENRARDWFNRFIDGTFLDGSTAGIPHWKATDLIGWWNEYYADSQDPAEKELWWRQERTAARIWRDEYRNGPQAAKLGHIRLAICATAVGNDIPWQSAETATLYDAVLDYHAYSYWEMIDGEPIRAANDWADLAGLWETLDNDFRARGYTCKWLFGEAGPFSSAVTGWRHEGVLGGSIPLYVEAVRQFVQDTKDSHAYQSGRVFGFALFTTGGGSLWEWFETRQPELNALAEMVTAEWTPVEPPPPQPPPLPPAVVAQLWQLSDAWPHKINFSPNLGLWQAILASGRTPVHTELSTTIEGQPYAVQLAFAPGQEDVLHVWTPGLPLLVLERPSIPHVERPLGVDVSRWQGVMNWAKTKAAGAWFAFIKATEHTGWIDPLFDENWQGARAAGLLVGAYHFFRPGYDPIAQANHFVNTVKAQPGAANLPYVLDVEIAPTKAARLLEVEDGYMGQSGAGGQSKGYGRLNTAAVLGFADNVRACLERITALTGRKPLLYTGIAFWDTYLRSIPTSICELWLANWTTNPDPFMPKDWQTWTFWQFSNSGSGPQYGAPSERIDVNRFKGTLVGLHEYAGEW